MEKTIVRRGDIWRANLPVMPESSVQGGIRPVLVIQTDYINIKSPTVNVLAVTSQIKRTDLDYHVELPWMPGLAKKSMVLAEQVFTLDQNKLFDFRCRVPEEAMKEVDRARRLVTRRKIGHKQARHRRRKVRYSSKALIKKKATIKPK